MASLFCLFKFRSHRPNQGLAPVNPAFAEKVSFHLVHKAGAINQVNAGEPSRMNGMARNVFRSFS